jgi:hypothetical protein
VRARDTHESFHSLLVAVHLGLGHEGRRSLFEPRGEYAAWQLEAWSSAILLRCIFDRRIMGRLVLYISNYPAHLEQTLCIPVSS